MKKVKVIFSLILALFVMTGTVYAWNEFEHVKIAPNGKGDVLLYPFHAAFSDWETTIEVINTSNTYASVAKLVVRSYMDSRECIDFLLYLTPNDVWKGKIMLAQTAMLDTARGTNTIVPGDLIITSTDDSVLYRFPTGTGCTAAANAVDFASEATPFTTEIFSPSCAGANGPFDSCQLGYVNIIESVSIVRTGAPFNSQSGPIDKEDLFNWYWPDGIQPCAGGGMPVAMTDAIQPRNILTGKMIFNAIDQNINSSVNATVLRDYDNSVSLTTYTETFLGEDARNSYGEVEAALSKNDLAMQYSSAGSIHFFTFPKKYPLIDYLDDDGDGYCEVDNYSRSPYFNFVDLDRNRCIQYSATDYNLEEETVAGEGIIISPPVQGAGPAQMCGELNIRAGFSFAEGWARYTFFNADNMAAGYTNFDVADDIDSDGDTDVTDYDDSSFTGAPVLGTVLEFTNNGFLHEGAYTPGEVFWEPDGNPAASDATGATPSEIEFYQYYDLLQYDVAGALYPDTTPTSGLTHEITDVEGDTDAQGEAR